MLYEVPTSLTINWFLLCSMEYTLKSDGACMPKPRVRGVGWQLEDAYEVFYRLGFPHLRESAMTAKNTSPSLPVWLLRNKT